MSARIAEEAVERGGRVIDPEAAEDLPLEAMMMTRTTRELRSTKAAGR